MRPLPFVRKASMDSAETTDLRCRVASRRPLYLPHAGDHQQHQHRSEQYGYYAPAGKPKSMTKSPFCRHVAPSFDWYCHDTHGVKQYLSRVPPDFPRRPAPRPQTRRRRLPPPITSFPRWPAPKPKTRRRPPPITSFPRRPAPRPQTRRRRPPPLRHSRVGGNLAACEPCGSIGIPATTTEEPEPGVSTL